MSPVGAGVRVGAQQAHGADHCRPGAERPDPCHARARPPSKRIRRFLTGGGQRNAGQHLEPTVRPGSVRQVSVAGLHSLPHPDKALPRARRGHGAGRLFGWRVADEHIHRPGCDRHVHFGFGGRSVLHDVGQRLLNQAVKGDVDCSRRSRIASGHGHPDREPASTPTLDQRDDPGQPERWSPLVATVEAHSDDPTQLDHRRPPRLHDFLERCPGQVGLGGEGDAGGPGLHHHHAEGVRDDVVQVPGYPIALGLGDERQPHLLFPTQPSRRHRESLGQVALAADEQAGRSRNDSDGKCVFDHVRDVQRTGGTGCNDTHDDPVEDEAGQLSDLATGDTPRPGRVHRQQHRERHDQVVGVQRMGADERFVADCPATGDEHGRFRSPAAPCHRRRRGHRANHCQERQAGGRGAGHPEAEHHSGHGSGHEAVDERRPTPLGPQGGSCDLSCSAHLASVRRRTSLGVVQKKDPPVVAEATGGSLLWLTTAGARRHTLIP